MTKWIEVVSVDTRAPRLRSHLHDGVTRGPLSTNSPMNGSQNGDSGQNADYVLSPRLSAPVLTDEEAFTGTGQPVDRI